MIIINIECQEANLKDLVISVGDHDLRDTADEEIIVKEKTTKISFLIRIECNINKAEVPNTTLKKFV